MLIRINFQEKLSGLWNKTKKFAGKKTGSTARAYFQTHTKSILMLISNIKTIFRKKSKTAVLIDATMQLQQQISEEINREKITKTFQVIIDQQEGDYWNGRTEFDSPNVDNEV